MMLPATPPPHPTAYVSRLTESTFPALRSAQGAVGQLLTEAYEARTRWPGHSVSLVPKGEPDTDLLDSPLGYITLPVVRTVEATFTHAGRLQPMPLPDFDE
jgi:hypothetical protein